MKKMLLPLFLMSLILSGCYYDEGPVISLRTPENRLVNKWDYKKYTVNGQDVTTMFQSSWAEFKSDKNSTFYIDSSNTYYASWSFSDDFRNLYLDCINDSDSVWTIDYYILKLRDKELWMKSDDGSVTTYIEFEQY